MWLSLSLTVDDKPKGLVREPVWGIELPNSQPEPGYGSPESVSLVDASVLPAGWIAARSSVSIHADVDGPIPDGVDVRLGVQLLEDASDIWQRRLAAAGVPDAGFEAFSFEPEFVVGLYLADEGVNHMGALARCELIYEGSTVETLRLGWERFGERPLAGFDEVMIAQDDAPFAVSWRHVAGRRAVVFLPCFPLWISL